MIVANNTTREFFVFHNDSQREHYLRDLIIPDKTKKNKSNSNDTHWRRSDHIIVVEDPKLQQYVMREYGQLSMC